MIARTTMIIALGLSLQACVSVLPKPKAPNSVYRLTQNAQPVAKSPTAEAIRVDRPTVHQTFNSHDIVTTSNDGKVAVLAGANWAETAPVIIQNAMINALAESPNYIGLIPTSGARTKTRIHLTVVNFEAQFDQGRDAAPLAVVSYRVTYAQADNRNLLGTYAVQKSVRADAAKVSSVVDAIGQANEDAMQDIVRWLDTQSSTNRT